MNQNQRYPGQPDNEIWFYDKNMPYYWLTNFYASPIECELPIEIISGGDSRNFFLDEKGKLSSSHEYFYNKELNLMRMSEKKRWKELAKKEKAEKIKWHTSEHLYQAFKLTGWNNYLGSDYRGNGMYVELNGLVGGGLKGFNLLAMGIDKIRKTPNPSEVRDFVNEGYNSGNGLRVDWFSEERPSVSPWDSTVIPIRLRAMRFAVQEKFNQNPRLKKMLWETGHKKLVEHSPDSFWGDGGNGSGQNWLGEILMEIRLKIIHSAARGEWNPSEIQAESPEPNTTATDTENAEPNISTKDTENEEKIALIKKNISEIRAKLNAFGISPEQEIEILGNSWENTYHHQHYQTTEAIEAFKKEKTDAIDEFIIKNSNDNSKPTSESPQPSQPQVNINNATDKLNQVKESDNKEELARVLAETQDITKNNADENLNRAKEEVERKLGEVDKEALRKHIREEVKNVLQENQIKPEELSLPIKQKLDELNNNEIHNNNDQTTRTEIFNEVGKQVLNKIITAVWQALKLQDKKKIKSKVKELQAFINSQIYYKKNAYQAKKEEIEKLLVQAKNQQSNQNDKESFFRANNPTMWIYGLALSGLVVVITLIIVRARRKKKVR